MIILTILLVILFLLIAFLVFHKFYFLRDPVRTIPYGNNIVCPADGKISLIKEFKENKTQINKKYLGHVKTMTSDVSKNGYIISIFMNILDVHINRAPIDGSIKYVKHSKGKFLNASTLESTFENENVQLLIQDGAFKIKMIQIAGLVARRIVSFMKNNEKVIKGQRVGLIKLGSQVTLVLPSNVKIQVKEGQKVLAGETIIAKRWISKKIFPIC